MNLDAAYADLASAADALKRSIDSRRASLQRQIEEEIGPESGFTPDDILDASGRPILGDLLAAYCVALAALVRRPS